MRCSPGIDHVADRQSSVLRRVFRCGLAVVLVVGGMVLGPATLAQQALPWMDASLPPEQRAALLLDTMTLDQKLQQIYNEPIYNDDLDVDGNPATDERTRLDCDFTPVGRHIEGIPELAIPDFRMANGGTGIRGGDCSRSRLPRRYRPRSPPPPRSTATFCSVGARSWTWSFTRGRITCCGARS